jgi:peptidoglycan-associated lipoprotein
MTARVVPLLVTVVVLAGCGRKPAPEAPAPVPGRAAPAADATPVSPADDGAEGRRAEALAAQRRALEAPVYFGFDRSDVDAVARVHLDEKAAVMEANPAIRVRIEGHADERGSDEYNLALGMRRAVAAKQHLVGRGLDEGRLEVVSYGEERPAATGASEEAWTLNRRDEFRVVEGDVLAAGDD